MKLSESKEIIIMPYKRLCRELENNLPEKKTIALFLTMEETNHPALAYLDSWYTVHVFDTEMEEHPFAFKVENGTKISEFLKKESDFECLYVCCDSGESRSTAMAAAIMKYFGREDKEIWKNPHYHPNILVYKNQLSAFGIRVNKVKLKILRYINERALKRVISEKR